MQCFIRKKERKNRETITRELMYFTYKSIHSPFKYAHDYIVKKRKKKRRERRIHSGG